MITNKVILFASLLPFLIKSIDMVDEIAFSNVSTLDDTNRVAREIKTKTVIEFKLN